jgi:hypothetical protein
MGGYESDGVQPIAVRIVDLDQIRNWATPIKPPYVKKTTVKTYIIDPTAANGAKNASICDYEPTRMRLAIQVIDAAVSLTLDPPTSSPDISTPTIAPQGRYLPPNVASREYEFFGPDAMYLNSLAAVTRVTVTKEYC